MIFWTFVYNTINRRVVVVVIIIVVWVLHKSVYLTLNNNKNNKRKREQVAHTLTLKLKLPFFKFIHIVFTQICISYHHGWCVYTHTIFIRLENDVEILTHCLKQSFVYTRVPLQSVRCCTALDFLWMQMSWFHIHAHLLTRIFNLLPHTHTYPHLNLTHSVSFVFINIYSSSHFLLHNWK